jgi:hypothetical protein
VVNHFFVRATNQASAFNFRLYKSIGQNAEAAMTMVTREQFRIRSEVEIVHIPTGAIFSTYPYSDPDDMLRSVTAQWGQVELGMDLKDNYPRQEIGRVAAELLLEQARRARRVRQ